MVGRRSKLSVDALHRMTLCRQARPQQQAEQQAAGAGSGTGGGVVATAMCQQP